MVLKVSPSVHARFTVIVGLLPVIVYRSFASNSRSLEGPFTLGSRSVHASNIGPLTVHMPCLRGGSGPGFPII